MRDPARIQRICDKLAEEWSKTPDLRFGQLLVNIGYLEMAELRKVYDPYHYEDDRIEHALERGCSEP